MKITLDLVDYENNYLDDVGTGDDGERYFYEDFEHKWEKNGAKAKQWRAFLSFFRTSDWGDRSGFHVLGCSCNQYLAGTCIQNCKAMTKMVYMYGGFPADFNPPKDETNKYTSSAESYG